MNPLLASDAIDRFLNGFSPKSRRRGHHYFLDKAVVNWGASDDRQFWLYCAWELRQRGLPFPECLGSVTDFRGIEPAMRAWQRSETIELWRKQLAKSQSSMEREPDLVDLRLKILPREARLQWKTQSELEFKDLKQTHLQHLCEDQQRGTLSVIPEALPLWLAIYRPYDFFAACNLEYNRAETAQALGRMLRLPHIADRLVTREDLPLAQPAEPLRYQLHAAGDESEDYRLGLVQADGSGAPPFLLVSPGRPNLYLTETALFRGPQPQSRCKAGAGSVTVGVFLYDSFWICAPNAKSRLS